MRSRWLILALMLLALPAFAAGPTEVRTDEAGRVRSRAFSFTTGDTSDSVGIPNLCAGWQASFTAGTGGVVAVYAVETSTQATSAGVLLSTFSSTSAVPTSFSTTYPYIKLDAVTAPSGSTVATIYLYCKLEASSGSGGGVAGAVNGRKILFVGDSYVSGHITDEFWAARYAQHGWLGGGYIARFAALLGAQPSGNAVGVGLSGTTQVIVCSARTSGATFGTNPDCDLVEKARSDPTITDIVLASVGTNDYTFDCSHGSPFNPGSGVSGPCTVAQTIENLQFLLGQLTALGRNVYWQVPPGWLGPFQLVGAPYDDAIEDVIDALVTFCVGKTCYAGKSVYTEACKGDTAAPDPTAAGDCAATNLIDYGDGLGKVNRLNAPLMYNEDTIFLDRIFATYGAGGYRIHPSGYGFAAFTRALAADIFAADPAIPGRITGFSLDYTKRPGLPGLTIGATTATTITVTPTRGLYIDGTDDVGDDEDGRCGAHFNGNYADCYYTCWATCNDDDLASTDPACPTTGETAIVRDIGAPTGAAHYIEGGATSAWIESPRNVVILDNGDTGVLRGLHTATEYKVVCVAISPTAISHPAVRNVTTP